MKCDTTTTRFLAILTAVLTLSSLGAESSANCLQSITVDIGTDYFCSHRVNQSAHQSSNDAVEWLCPDLQSALVIAVNLSLGPTAENSEQQDCICIAVPPGDHSISAPVHFNDASVSVFGTGGQPDDVTILCNYTVDVNESRIFDLDYDYTDYTFYFNRSDIVLFENVQFVGCPYPLRIDTVATVKVCGCTFINFTEAVFDIFNSGNISITDCDFINNSGTGISRYSFRANTGAVAVGYNNIPMYFQQIAAKVERCNFTNNRATAKRSFRSTNSAFFSRIFTGRGGAIGVFHNESYYDVTISISDSHFENNYARSFGGAVFLVYFGNGTQNQNILERNVFVDNFACLGGGAVLSTFFSNGVRERPHSALISDCTFTGNGAQSGGALFVYQAYKIFGVSFVRCERCNFTKNHGSDTRDEFGAAIGIYLVNQFSNKEAVPRNEFIDCIFEQNSGKNGIVSIAYTPVLFTGTNKFIGNVGTDSLRIIGSLVNFQGNLQFINNTDTKTVAMHLLSFGQVRLFSGVQLSFLDNKGIFGASILVDSQKTPVAFGLLANNPLCFALHGNASSPPGQWNDVSVSFQRNTAVLGSSIAISRLESCTWASTNLFNRTFLFDWPIWDYGSDSINSGYEDKYNNEHSVVTEVYTISITNQSVTTSTPPNIAVFLLHPYLQVKAWPGQWFLIELKGWDQFSHLTIANARLSFSSQDQELVVVFNPQVLVLDARDNTSLVKEFAITYSISSGDGLVNNGSFGSVTIDEPIGQKVAKPANFTLYALPCPAGYDLVNTGQQQGGLECQCDNNNKLIINCEDDQDSIIVEEGYWGAAVLASSKYRYDLFLHPCPPEYCKCRLKTSLGPSICAFTYTNSDPEDQCMFNRKGILCGECRGGMGVTALLNNCVSCHNAHGLLILALIVADAIAFFVIVVVDIPLPGWTYPFIFYIQVAPLVGIYFPESFIKGGKFLHFISSATGFYFVYDFCLFGNMNPLVSYFIRYFPILVALLVLPVVFIIRKRNLMTLEHHGIWWIILLLYAHIVHTSVSILECPLLPMSSFPRWIVNGNIECFTGWHAPLALLAIAMLVVTVTLVPLVGLISVKQHLFKSLYWLKYIEGPLTVMYKEDWGWWSAIELARRFTFILFVIPFPRNSIPPLLVMCITLVTYGFIQPYKSQLSNILEIVVQANFVLLLALESTTFLEDAYGVYLSTETDTAVSPNATNAYTDGAPGISAFTTILLPFYYAPLLLFIVVATVKLILHFMNKKMAKSKPLQRSATLYETQSHVTNSEVCIGDVDYVIVTNH